MRGNLKPENSHEPQLVLGEVVLPSGGEWAVQAPGWLLIHVSSGVGYWMSPRANCELQTGAVVIHSDQIRGCVRASQMGELHLHYFRTEPGKLTGLVTMAD